MKTFYSTTTILCLATASASSLTSVSVSANNQCNLPQRTSAHPYERNYQFTREMIRFGGSTPNTTCSGQKSSEFRNINSADNCASACAKKDADDNSSLTLLGYNYNCRTEKCDCIWGNQRDDLDRTVKTVSSSWACYKSDTAMPSPTPPPTPAPNQCELPSTTTGSKFGNTFSFTRVDPQYSGTTCHVGTGFLPVESNSVEDCANYCVGKNPASGMNMWAFDYNCDSQQCTCLTAHPGTNLQANIQTTNQNMACYFKEAQMDTQKYLRAN